MCLLQDGLRGVMPTDRQIPSEDAVREIEECYNEAVSSGLILDGDHHVKH